MVDSQWSQGRPGGGGGSQGEPKDGPGEGARIEGVALGLSWGILGLSWGNDKQTWNNKEGATRDASRWDTWLSYPK